MIEVFQLTKRTKLSVFSITVFIAVLLLFLYLTGFFNPALIVCETDECQYFSEMPVENLELEISNNSLNQNSSTTLSKDYGISFSVKNFDEITHEIIAVCETQNGNSPKVLHSSSVLPEKDEKIDLFGFLNPKPEYRQEKPQLFRKNFFNGPLFAVSFSKCFVSCISCSGEHNKISIELE